MAHSPFGCDLHERAAPRSRVLLKSCIVVYLYVIRVRHEHINMMQYGCRVWMRCLGLQVGRVSFCSLRLVFEIEWSPDV